MSATGQNRRAAMRLADDHRYQCLPKGDGDQMRLNCEGERTGQWNDQNRLYRHARNAHGGVDSICLRCPRVVASADDEWLLLDDERRHACSRQPEIYPPGEKHE
jgi:hypothetical protein